jgi:hypothetical protein
LEKRGLGDQLKAAHHKQTDDIRWVDEMRLGLQGYVRRVWVGQGVKVRQRLQFVFEWVYLLLSVNPVTGKLHWAWVKSMKQVDLKPTLETWSPDAVVWDGASSHRAKGMKELGFTCILQPPYSPELNPVERIFEELRKVSEGRLYPSLMAKKKKVEAELRRLAAKPALVKRLVSWRWILDSLQSLPAHPHNTSLA